MKKILTLLTLCLAFAATAQDVITQSVTSKIEQVTVYLNGAQVTRSATAILSRGRSEVVFTGLSPTGLNLNTLQVRADSGNCTVLSVTHRYNFLNPTVKIDTIVQLEKQRDELTEFYTLQTNSIALVTQEEQLLQRNQTQILGIQNTTLKVEDLRQLVDYQRGRATELMNKRFELQRSTKKIKDELDATIRQINELQNVQTERRLEVVVEVQAIQAASARFELKYQTTAAQWLPEYDLRVSDVTAPLSLLMRAKVRQYSGEDWKNVRLALSTADPNQSGLKPELGTWRLMPPTFSGGVSNFKQQFPNDLEAMRSGSNGVSYGVSAGNVEIKVASSNTNSKAVTGKVISKNGEPISFATIVWKNSKGGVQSDFDGNFVLQRISGEQRIIVSSVGYESSEVSVEKGDGFTITLNEGAKLQEVVITSGRRERSKREDDKNATVENTERIQTTTTQFDIELPYNIASDNRFYNVDIKTVQIPAAYTYYVVPKLDKDAFLFAEITDWEQYNLLAGESNVFFENTFVGKTILNTNELGDTLRISLGRDKNIGVERTKLRDFSKRNFLGDRKSDSRAYEIKIRNKKKAAVNIIVEDQVPVSGDKSIEVESEAKTATIDAATGKVTWRINALKPSGEQKLQLQYTVRYPKEMTLNVN